LRLFLLIQLALFPPFGSLFGQDADSSFTLPIVHIQSTIPLLKVESQTVGWQADSLGRFPFSSWEVSDALARLPGLYIRDYGGHGGIRSVSVRGMASNQTALVIDGIPVPEMQSGVFDFNGWLLDGFQSVELTSSDAASQMGNTGNRIELKSGTLPNSVSGGMGSFGERMLGMSYSKQINRYNIGGQYRNVLAHGRFPYTTNGVSGTRKDAEYELHQWQLGAGLDLQKKWGRLQYRQMGFFRNQGVPGPVVKANPGNENEKMYQQQLFHYLAWDLKDQIKFRPKLGLSHRRNLLELRDNRQTATNFELNTYSFTSQISSPTKKANWGADLRATHSNLSSNRLAVNFRPISSISRNEMYVGINSVWNIKRDTIGSSTTNLTIGINGASVQGFEPQWAASILLEQTISKKQGLIGFASISRGFRFPTFNEMYYFAFGNPQLKAETTLQASIGMRLAPVSIRWLTARLLCFGNQTENKILSIPISPVRWTTFALGETRSRGGEASVYIEPRKGSILYFNSTYTKAEDFSVSEGSQIPYTPYWLLQGGIESKIGPINAGLSGQYIGNRYSSLVNNDFYLLERVVLLDANIGSLMKTGKHKLSIEAGIRNVLSNPYVLIQSFPMPGRNYWFRLKWHLNS